MSISSETIRVVGPLLVLAVVVTLLVALVAPHLRTRRSRPDERR